MDEPLVTCHSSLVTRFLTMSRVDWAAFNAAALAMSDAELDEAERIELRTRRRRNWLLVMSHARLTHHGGGHRGKLKVIHQSEVS